MEKLILDSGRWPQELECTSAKLTGKLSNINKLIGSWVKVINANFKISVLFTFEQLY